jgi:hypothetical protein
MSEFLNQSELHQLTGYARPTSQASWLKEHGLPHRLDRGRVIVSRVHVQAWLEGRAVVSNGLRMEFVK